MAETDDSDLGISTSTGANPSAAKVVAGVVDNDAPDTGKPDGKPDTGADDVEWTPPTKAEWDKTQKDLATANRESKDRRQKLLELQRVSEDADGKAARETAEAAEARYKPIAVKAAARAAFMEAGLAGTEGVAKLTRMLDLDTIEIDDDGDVVGLAEQVATLKTEFPALFAPSTTPKPRAPRLDAGNRREAPARAKSSAELIAEQVFGGAA